jgi:methionyl-tRNA formyltransferase
MKNKNLQGNFFDRIGNRKKILFLTNNDNTLTLFEWLKNQNEDIWLYGEKITPDFIKDNGIGFIISYNYRIIIKPEIIHLLPHRIINLHTSYLPYNRGASPNIWSFIENTPCGVTIHEIDRGIDTGDILIQEQINYDYKKETLETAYKKSNKQIQELFCKNWDKIKKNEIIPQKQTHKGTFHLAKDLEQYKGIIDYKDSIEVFLEKVNKSRKNGT